MLNEMELNTKYICSIWCMHEISERCDRFFEAMKEEEEVDVAVYICESELCKWNLNGVWSYLRT